MFADNKKILKVALAAWIVIWANFTVRDLVKGRWFTEYRTLLFKDASGRASYVYGERLFEFLNFSMGNLPRGVTYDLAGPAVDDKGSLDSMRSIYYLYPNIQEENAMYQLVFDKPGYRKAGYELFKKLDEGRFILRRI
jgi:hypothetical protein